MNIGDKLICDNGHTYTLGEGDGYYTFSIIDENGEETNLYMNYAIEDCLPYFEEDAKQLHVADDKYTFVIEYIENEDCLND